MQVVGTLVVLEVGDIALSDAIVGDSAMLLNTATHITTKDAST